MGKSSYFLDWANLNRYANDNSRIESDTKEQNSIVFIGDSITEAWENIDPSFFTDKPYINRGISGQTSPQILLRFRADVINLNPVLVVILAGTNDIAGNTGPSTLDMILNNIISMAELARCNNIKTILCSVLPAFKYKWRPEIEPALKIIRINEMIREYALKNDITYVDYHSAMTNNCKGLHSDYSEDGVHPNLAGYKIMTPLIENSIETVLEQIKLE